MTLHCVLSSVIFLQIMRFLNCSTVPAGVVCQILEVTREVKNAMDLNLEIAEARIECISQSNK